MSIPKKVHVFRDSPLSERPFKRNTLVNLGKSKFIEFSTTPPHIYPLICPQHKMCSRIS